MNRLKQGAVVIAIAGMLASSVGVPAYAAPELSAMIFTSNREGTTEIYSASRSGDNMKKLSNNDIEEQSIAASPDGSKIVYATSSDRGPSTLAVLDIKTGKETVIATTPGNEYQSPVWSPNGEHIAYSMTMLDTDSQFMSCITVMNIVTRETRKVSCADQALMSPSWSPDGQRLLFTQFVAATGGDLYTVRPFKNEERQYVRSGFSGVFAPVGDKIAYTAWDARYVNQIFIVNSDGSSPRQLTYGDDLSTVVDWAADDYIAYTNVTVGTWQFQAKSIKSDGSSVKTIPQKPGTIDVAGKGLVRY